MTFQQEKTWFQGTCPEHGGQCPHTLTHLKNAHTSVKKVDLAPKKATFVIHIPLRSGHRLSSQLSQLILKNEIL